MMVTWTDSEQEWPGVPESPAWGLPQAPGSLVVSKRLFTCRALGPWGPGARQRASSELPGVDESPFPGDGPWPPAASPLPCPVPTVQTAPLPLHQSDTPSPPQSHCWWKHHPMTHEAQP